MNFNTLSEAELLSAYKGYQLLKKTGAVGETDFDGLFRKAIDEAEAEHPGFGIINATNGLMLAIAKKWVAEQELISGMLSPNDVIWYADDDTGKIEKAVVQNVQYKDGKLDVFSAEFPDSDDFDEFFGSALGSCFFRSETQAKLAISHANKETVLTSTALVARGTPIWGTDIAGNICRGIVSSVRYVDGKLEHLSVHFPESNDVEELPGDAVGSALFLSEEDVRKHLRKK